MNPSLRLALAFLLAACSTAALAAELRFADGGRYEGDVVDGKRHGRGTYYWPGGTDFYEGEFVDNHRQGKGKQLHRGFRYEGDFVAGRFHGKGVLVYPDGRRYEGDMVQDRHQGQGVMTWPNGGRYEGEFVDNHRQGKGKQLYNGFRYEGDFVANRFNGKGVLVYPDGRRYEGDMVQDRHQGQGVMTWPDGNRYEGAFVQNKRHGKGIFSRPDGHRYEGDFADDKANGQGVLAYADGRRYEGGFLDDVRAGVGVLVFPNGVRYEGGFLDDKYSGKGVLAWPDGHRYDGDFVAGNYHGYGVMRWPDGAYYAGQWVNDKRQGPVTRDGEGGGSNASQVIAGAIGLGIISGASGLSSAEKVRVGAGFVSDVMGDGKGQGTQAALSDVRSARVQSAEIQNVIAEQARRAQLARQQASTAPAPQVRQQGPAGAQQPVQLSLQQAAVPTSPAVLPPPTDFDALLRAAPKTERYVFTCGPHTGPAMLPQDVPGSCMAEQKRHMLIQCFPGWLFDESYGELRKCAAEKSTGKFKVEHQQRLDAHREMLRREMPRCAPDGCSGREHLGIL